MGGHLRPCVPHLPLLSLAASTPDPPLERHPPADSVVLGLFILLGCALAYFPPHLAHVLERWRYYLSGSSELA